MEIYTDTLSEAHEAAFDAILSRHKEIDIQTHIDKKEFTLEFENKDGDPDEIKIKVKYPLQEPQVSAGSEFGPLFTKAYKKQFLTISPPRADGNHATYTYWNRIKDFPIANCLTGGWCGDGKGDGFDQVSALIKKLASDINSRRGVMVTWNPQLDSPSREPPCMNWLQAVIRNGKLYLRVLFRSQDILLGLPENLVGCTALFEWLLFELNQLGLNLKMGTLTLISTIPHIYKKRDSKGFSIMRAHIDAQKKFGRWKPRIVE